MDNIKVLALETHYATPDGTERLSSVDWWRIINPLYHVSLNTNVEVDFLKKIVPDGGSAENSYEEIGDRDYDIIYSSYIDTPKAYAWIKAVCAKYGAKYIMDLDDNIFQVDENSPPYLKYHEGSEGLRNATIMIQDADYMSVSTPHLANVCSRYRGGNTPEVLPNYIDPNAYVYDSSKVPDNGDDIVIGYQGSSTHFSDFFKTGIFFAIKRILREYPNTKFYSIGMLSEEMFRYVPKERFIQGEGTRDADTWKKVWQTLPIDIGLAPLVNSPFNLGKSSIKYYEYALREIPAVYSWVEPYIQVVQEHYTGYLAQNEIEWYEKIKYLVENKSRRQSIGKEARVDVLQNYTIQDNWKPVYEFLKKVNDD